MNKFFNKNLFINSSSKNEETGCGTEKKKILLKIYQKLSIVHQKFIKIDEKYLLPCYSEKI